MKTPKSVLNPTEISRKNPVEFRFFLGNYCALLLPYVMRNIHVILDGLHMKHFNENTEHILSLFVRKALGCDKHPFQYYLSCYRHFISGVSVFGGLCWMGYQRVNSWSGMVLLWHVFPYTIFSQSRIRVFSIKILKY